MLLPSLGVRVLRTQTHVRVPTFQPNVFDVSIINARMVGEAVRTRTLIRL